MSRTPRWPLVVALLTLGTAAPAHAMDLKLSPRFEHVQPMAPGADEPLLLPGPSAPQAEALYAAATQAVMRGDVSAAEMACRQAIDLSPGHCDARTALAGLLLDSGRIEEADEMLRVGLQIAPQHPGLRLLKGRRLVQAGEPREALRLLLRNAPPLNSYPDYHALIAAVYARMDRHQAAALTYRALLAANPQRGSWWVGYGISQERRGLRSEAVGAYRHALAAPGLGDVLRRFVDERLRALGGASR